LEVERLSLTHKGGVTPSVESAWIGKIGNDRDSASILLRITLEHTKLPDGLVKYTWRVEVENPTGETMKLSLTLILTDQRDDVVQASTIDDAVVPAKATAGFAQTAPIAESDWDQIVEHEITVVSD
jgi:hypothetical protein